ncbi:hypothetical protein QJS10_CPA08g01523 [Acorus calamus]|uniref:LysM domain-containing protein n=1 Tax=Acorus calamus TaxID=4465 RepID=A0AAV9EC20_ACOCL|nr:hypothetical protein QJS10_CPA08g01523 [Acorus calamus]
MAPVEKFCWYSALIIGLAFMFCIVCDPTKDPNSGPCREMYIVKGGETLHSIADKCEDPFIIEDNPHVQDDADVYPGLVLKITPYRVR